MEIKIDFLTLKFLKSFDFKLNGTENVFIVGVGGGSDVIGAFGVATMLQYKYPKSKIYYGLCVSEKKNYYGFKKINNSLYQRIPNTQETNDELHHSLKLIKEMENFDNHLSSPYLIPRPKINQDKSNQNEINLAIQNAINELNPDILYAIDLGGDSLTCGIDGNEFGFDRTGLKALQQLNKPFIYLVLGLGCDGESTMEMILQSIENEFKVGALLGELDLDEIISFMQPVSKILLDENRTPNIIANAKIQISKNPANATILQTIKRHRNPEIPLNWLIKGIAIEGLKFSGKCLNS